MWRSGSGEGRQLRLSILYGLILFDEEIDIFAEILVIRQRIPALTIRMAAWLKQFLGAVFQKAVMVLFG